jgi:hypothetical protein
MNPRELVDHIRSGPAELVLREPLRFRRLTRSNPCDFNEFLEALQSSVTIRNVACGTHIELGITEDEWVLLVKTIGRITDITNLTFECGSGSRDFRPFQAIAHAVESAQSLYNLVIALMNRDSLGIEHFAGDPSELTELANALREHLALHIFAWAEIGFEMEAAENTTFDPVLRALSACPNLEAAYIMTIFASDEAIVNLLYLPTNITSLALAVEPDHWLVASNVICQSWCRIASLHLQMMPCLRSEATEAIKAVADAIRHDHELDGHDLIDLTLQMEDGFTDEVGVALAEALTTNKTLHTITLSDDPCGPPLRRRVHNQAALGVSAYEAFSAMLRVNTGLTLNLPPCNDITANDKRVVDSREQVRIEQELNYVGRGELLSSNQTTREEWVDALDELNSGNVDESPEFNVSCLYSLLRLNPGTCMA